MKCLQCNFENSDTAKFCDHCGILLYASYRAHIRNNKVITEEIVATLPILPTKRKRDKTLKMLRIVISIVGMILLITILMMFFILATEEPT
ncbi:zinc-ribbon domain-containing protein [Paenibacillus sp. FA6]|uniref:zinc-ribbon domain-containing protein n=1 Tax=Paenibacillus sp. FA6 TaxID=3413029 RepID=UPI003F6582C5